LAAAGWSNRIVFLAIAGILFLTLYPFRFFFPSVVYGDKFPLLLGGWGKDATRLDEFLNVLLFVPLGFGIALKLRQRSLSTAAVLGLAFAAGAMLSYTVELLQFYIPQRDSGWEDIITNSTGSFTGALLCYLTGAAVLTVLSACERLIDEFLTLPRAVVVLLVYLGLWFALSVPLQAEASLNSWKQDCLLVIGNRVQSRSSPGWQGEISRLEFWDRALPASAPRNLTSAGSAGTEVPAPLAAYDFSGLPPFRDQRALLPDLDWISKPSSATSLRGVALDGESLLASRAPVSAWVDNVRTSGQFSVRVVCQPLQLAGMDARIVSIDDAAGPVDFELRQNGDRLVVWFRSALLIKSPRLVWSRADVFASGQSRDILVSYDGSTLAVYVDGKQQGSNFEIGGGASLARFIGRARVSELIGYRYIYYAIIFSPAGCLLGFAFRKLARTPGSVFLLVSGVLLPAVLFEILIVFLSGRPARFGDFALSVSLMLGGSLWINSDRGAAIGRQRVPTTGLPA
jgi:VanZ family protein